MTDNIIDQIASFQSKLKDQQKLDHLGRTLSQELQSFGLETFTYVATKPPKSKARSYIHSTYPTEWLEHYVKNDYILHDPVFLQARNSMLPIQWGLGHGYFIKTSLQQQIVDQSRMFDHHGGLIIPVRGPRGEFASLIAISPEKDPTAFNKYFEHYREKLLITSMTYHDHIWQTLYDQPEETPDLSAMQFEVLKLCAGGKTTWEISQLLNISENTVRYHLKQASVNLDTYGVTATVAKAIAHGLVTP